MLTFKKFADLLVKVEEIDKFQDLCTQFSISIENIDRTSLYRNGRNIPQPFYMVQVSYENPACLFDIGRAIEALTKP